LFFVYKYDQREYIVIQIYGIQQPKGCSLRKKQPKGCYLRKWKKLRNVL